MNKLTIRHADKCGISSRKVFDIVRISNSLLIVMFLSHDILFAVSDLVFLLFHLQFLLSDLLSITTETYLH